MRLYNTYNLKYELNWTCIKRVNSIGCMYFNLFKTDRSGVDKDSNIIVSLTSIPSRINSVSYTIESILRQTVKPKKIILWLAKDEFDGVNLPIKLRMQTRRGLEIKYCDNIKSHKKYFYVMQQFPDNVIITLDDDLLYSEFLIKRLLDKSIRNPDAIIAARSHCIRLYPNGIPCRYSSWPKYENIMSCSRYVRFNNMFFTSGAGTLFPPHILPQEAYDSEVLMELTPTADDIWLNAMARIGNIKIITLSSNDGHLVVMDETQNDSLFVENVCNNKNDEQINNVIKKYGKIF